MKSTQFNFLIGIIICGVIMFMFSFSARLKYNIGNKKNELDKAQNSSEAEEREKYYFALLRDPATNKIPANIREKELQFATNLSIQNKLLKKVSSVNTLQWKEAGPVDVGGRTRALAVDVTNPNIVIAAGTSGGVWKSTDNGATWHIKSRTDQVLSVTSIAQDTRPGHTNTWYYSGGEARGSAQDQGFTAYFYGNGIYKSTDNGETWDILSNTESSNPTSWSGYFSYTSKITVNPTTGSVFVAANAFGIFRSSDGGATFNLVLGGTNEHQWSDVAVTATGTVVAVVSSPYQGYTATNAPGVYRSNDDGQTWTSITPNNFPQYNERSVLGVTAANPNIVYVLTNTGNLNTNKNEIITFYKINIADGTYDDRSSNLPDFTQLGNVAKTDGVIHSQNNWDLTIAVKPDDENFVLIAGTCLFRSTDGFSTKPDNVTLDWIGGYTPTSFDYPNFHSDIHSFAFDPIDPKKMWWGCDGGLEYTNDITNVNYNQYFPWQKKNNGYDVTQFYEIDIPPNANDDRIMGGCQDNGTPYFTFNGTSTSAHIDASSGDGSYAHFGTDYAYAESQNGRVYRLHYDQSGNVLPPFDNYPFSEVTPTNAKNQLFINPYVIDPNDGNVMYYLAGPDLWRNDQLNNIADGVYQTTQGWTDLTNFTAPQGYNYTTLAVSNSPAHVLYLAASNIQQGIPKIFKVDNANTASTGAVDISIPNAPAGAYVHDIAVNPNDANEIIVVMSNYNIVGLYHSTDGGQSYNAIEGNLLGTQQNPGPSLRCASILPTNNGTEYYIATSIGLFSTSQLNGSNTNWTQEAPNVIGNVVTNYVVSRTSDGEVAVGTHGRGTFVGTSNNNNGKPILAVDANQLTINVKPGQTGSTDFRLSNNGTALLNYSISPVGGPSSAYPIGTTNFARSSIIATPDFKEKFINDNLNKSYLKFSSSPLYKSVMKVTSGDSIIIDDGNNYADDIMGYYGYDFYWLSVFPVSKDFALDKIKFIMNTQADTGPAATNPVEIAVYPISNNVFGNILYDTTINMDTSYFGKWYEYDFPSAVLNNLDFKAGSQIGIIIGALNTTLLYPAGFDYNGQKPGNSYYYDPISKNWPNISSLGSVYANAAWVVRVFGNSGGTQNQPPVARADVSPQTADVNIDISFGATFSYDPDGQIVSYLWDFGDGNTNTFPITTHKYSQPGIYTYKLTVTDNLGAQGQATGQVTIQNGTMSRWTITPSSGNETPSGNQMINVYFNATGLAENQYQAELDVTSNGGNIVIPVLINVSNTATGVEPVSDIPKEFKLDQNYPNPFNPSTIISYSLPFESDVKIIVYNSLGEEVKQLVNNDQQANYYREEFNASNLSSGVYFYTIQAVSIDGKQKYKAVKKMLLLK